MALTTEKHLARISTAMQRDLRLLRPFRELRRRAWSQFVGFHYGDGGAPDKVPVNLLELAVSIYRRLLAGHRPRALVTTDDPDLRRLAAMFTVRLNELVEEIDYQTAQQDVVTEALFSQGIAKVGITWGNEHELQGVMHDAGLPFVDSIGLDDWVQDMSRTRWEQLAYAGHRYDLDYELAMDTILKGTDAQPSTQDRRSLWGDPPLSALSSGGDVHGQEPRDRIALWDLYLPAEGLVITINAENLEARPLRQVEWEGDERGPYHRLSFSKVSDNLMPAAPVGLWLDLHELANVLFRKLARQAVRQKTVTLHSGMDEDIDRILKAPDGWAVRNDRPRETQEARYGGPVAENMAFLLQVRSMFVYLAGNLDTLGGLSPQAGTLGQEEILSQHASERVRDMQARAAEFSRRVFEALMFYEWTDPLRDVMVTRKIPGTSIDVRGRWSPQTREGDLIQYRLEVEPYSMQAMPPAAKIAALGMLFDRFLMPMMPLLQAQGRVPDPDRLLSLLSTYSNMPELKDLFALVEPYQGGPIQERPRQSPVTTRNYVRRSVPGASRAGQDDVMSRLLLGARVQKSEAGPALEIP